MLALLAKVGGDTAGFLAAAGADDLEFGDAFPRDGFGLLVPSPLVDLALFEALLGGDASIP